MTQNTQKVLCIILLILPYTNDLVYDAKYTNNFVFTIVGLVIHKKPCYDTKNNN